MGVTVTSYLDPSTAGRRFVVGDRKMHLGVLTFDSSYPTGGESIAYTDFSFDAQLDALFVQSLPVAGTKLVTYDPVNKKLLVFTALGTEATNGSDQSTVTVPFVAIGK